MALGLFHRQRRARSRWETALEYAADEPLIMDMEIHDPKRVFDSRGIYGPKGAYDPLGSYTGVPADGGEPVQDADDL